jgi:hypothetical protein
MKQYVDMSFSYMTFVIQEKIISIETGDIGEDILLNQGFDVEAFNYILDKDNCFVDGSLAKANFLKLQQIFKSIKEVDPVYLELLHYSREDKLNMNDGSANLFSSVIRPKQERKET